MTLRPILLAGGVAVAALLSTAASAADITLFNTGVNAAGTVKANGAAETNYVLSTGAARVATSANGFPIPPWLGDNTLSAWIGPVGAADLDGPAGDYTYRTTFSLAGLNAATAQITGQWSTDDLGLDILLNGVSTGSTASGFQSFYSFSLTSGFVAGQNTLDFVVRNGGGPTGLRVEMTGTADALGGGAVPEPATWGLMGLGFGLVGFAVRRRRTLVAA